MPGHHIYLIASLPMLHFQATLPISSAQFMDSCRRLLDEDESGILEAILGGEELPKDIPGILRRWLNFDTALKNELVKLRSGRKKLDPAKYLRQNEYWDSGIIHTAMAAYKNTSVLEAEKILDLERWRFLEELCSQHYFDFDFLVVYALKVKMLERWEGVKRADKEKLLGEALN